MKINQNFVIYNTGGETLLVPTAEAPFHGLMQGNETLDFILNFLKNDVTEEEIISALAAEYEGNIDDMREDVASALEQLRKIGALEG